MVLVGFDGCGAYDGVLMWLWEKEEERRGKKRKRKWLRDKEKKEEERRGRIRKRNGRDKIN